MTPRVSVVMPARNAIPHVGGAIASVLAQTVEDLELVVVDDGSSDATAAVARAFADPRVVVVEGPARGVAAARNAGISAARASTIAFCDADDILLPTHLAALLGVLPADDAIATANAYWLFAGGIDVRKTRHRGRFPPPEDQRRAILEQNFVSTMSAFPRSVVDRIGPFAEDLTHAEDWDFWMRAVFAGIPIVHQPVPLALYRWGEGLSANRDGMDEAVREVLRRAQRLSLDADEADYVNRRLTGPSPQELTRHADDDLRAGRWRSAADGYAAAARLVPTEAPLLWKARLLRIAPWLFGRAIRWDMGRADQRRGTTSGRQR